MSSVNEASDIYLNNTAISSGTLTAQLSAWSDCLFAPLVPPAARRYAQRVGVPPHLLEFLFLVEDKRFPIHVGIDPLAIARACVFNLRGSALQGGSTLTQQIYDIRLQAAGNRRLRTAGRKIRQAAWSVWHSIWKKKQTLLARYLATVYWGRQYYGVTQAAAGYFGVLPSELTALQTFFLAERIAAPNRFSTRRLHALLQRRVIVRCLVKHGVPISQIFDLYETLYGPGGKRCKTQAKYNRS